MGRKKIYFTKEDRRKAVNARMRAKADFNRTIYRKICDCQATFTYNTDLDNYETQRLAHEESKRHIRFLKGKTLTEKYCVSCQTIKPASEYYITREYLQRFCKKCHNIQRNAKTLKTPED